MMQMQPLEYQETDSNLTLNLSIEAMLERVIDIAISYFTMATELRLLALREAGSKEAARESS
jgi:hypothetical protein